MGTGTGVMSVSPQRAISRGVCLLNCELIPSNHHHQTPIQAEAISADRLRGQVSCCIPMPVRLDASAPPSMVLMQT